MNQPILSLRLGNERDVVAARRRARQIAELLEFDAQDQTRIATAVSEIARNAVRYAGGGEVEFSASGQPRSASLRARISDRGKGIRELDRILDGSYESETGMGLGIIGARRIMDEFSIESSEAGTSVLLGKYLPRKVPALTPQRLARLTAKLASLDAEDLVGENQQQSRELLRMMDELRRRQEEILRINSELEDTNRGVVALYSELEDKAERLRTAGEMKSRFLSYMSHEFRTPLNSILALTRLLLQHADGPLTAEQETQVGFIRQSAENLYELVNDLLDLAKVEAGKTTVQVNDFTAAEFFGALRGILKPLQQNDGVELIFEEPAEIPPLRTDESKLAQILRNLVSNALKFTVRGEVRVSATWEPAGNAVVFTVADTGIGIAPEDLDHIFQEFAQVDSAVQKRVRGTGLGLPLSRKLAELLGGELTVTSRPGAGSTFRVRIPPMMVTEPESREPGGVLIVDDEQVARYLLRQLLSGTGLEILEAESGPQAIATARERRPGAILLDLRMPNMDGFEVLAELKANRRTRDIPVVVVTSRSLSQDERQVLSRDTASVLSKDFLSRNDAGARILEILASAGVTIAPAKTEPGVAPNEETRSHGR